MHIHNTAWVKLFSKYDIALTTKEKAEQSGRINTTFIAQVLNRRSADTLDPQQLAQEKEEIVLDILSREAFFVFPGVLEFLGILKKNKIQLALATSSTQKIALLLGRDVLDYFEVKVFAEDIINGKPDPEMFLLAAKQMHLDALDCVVFEDSESGITAAKSGGFMCVAKDNNQGQNLKKADIVIKEYMAKNLKEIFDIV